MEEKPHKHYLLIFLSCWLVTFVIYLPTARAGMVGDFPYWLDNVRSQSFTDYILNRHTALRSLYFFTQFTTWAFYKLFGIAPWAWHLFFITLHSVNCLLLYIFFKKLFADGSVAHANGITLAGVALFALCPHIAEVIVWEPAYHFLLAPLFIYSVLILLQRYMHTHNSKHALLAAVLFFVSSFSLEQFYLTPVFIFLVATYYKMQRQTPLKAYTKTLLLFLLPSIIILAVHFILLNHFYGVWVSHYGHLSFNDFFIFLSIPLKYVYHILFFGRFFPLAFRTSVYALCMNRNFALLLYGATALLFFIAFRNKNSGMPKLFLLLLSMLFCSMAILSPLDFPNLFLSLYDRYTYLSAGMVFVSLSLVVNRVANVYLRNLLLLAYGCVALKATLKVNRNWTHSEVIIDSLMNKLPAAGDKTILLLNLPAYLNGVPMIDAQEPSRFKLMRNTITTRKLNNKVYDCVAFNMTSENDGAHVNVVSDSTMIVTLNQWGTWWFYAMVGAQSYTTADYSLQLKDPVHWYELTLKHKASDYLILYLSDGKWNTVDWTKKGVDQY